MSDDLTGFANWLWAAFVALGAWTFRGFAGRMNATEGRLRRIELAQTKTATESRALFKRLDELKDSIHDLGSKLDRFMGR